MSFIPTNVEEVDKTLQEFLDFLEVVETNTAGCVHSNGKIQSRLTYYGLTRQKDYVKRIIYLKLALFSPYISRCSKISLKSCYVIQQILIQSPSETLMLFLSKRAPDESGSGTNDAYCTLYIVDEQLHSHNNYIVTTTTVKRPKSELQVSVEIL